jgi:biopolymer transport protein ExbB
LELVKAGGWIMLPIIACSILSLAIVAERLWTLQRRRVTPRHLVAQVWNLHKHGKLDTAQLIKLREGSPLGRILAAGLMNRHHDREIMKESIEETGRQVVHQLERYLNSLGTIAAITPLLGLLGTVIGMIKVFSAIMSHGVGDPPSLMFHRFFIGRVDELVITMEEEALKIVEVIHGRREHVVMEEEAS